MCLCSIHSPVYFIWKGKRGDKIVLQFKHAKVHPQVSWTFILSLTFQFHFKSEKSHTNQFSTRKDQVQQWKRQIQFKSTGSFWRQIVSFKVTLYFWPNLFVTLAKLTKLFKLDSNNNPPRAFNSVNYTPSAEKLNDLNGKSQVGSLTDSLERYKLDDKYFNSKMVAQFWSTFPKVRTCTCFLSL